MIVECGHCGAPLDIRENATVIVCAYCTKKNRVAGLKTIAATTPTDFKAPETWKTSETSAPLVYHPPKPWGRKVYAALLALAVVIGGIVYAVQTRGTTLEELAQLSLESRPDQIEKRFHVVYRADDTVHIGLRAGSTGPYERLVVRWDDKDFSLPTFLQLDVAEGSTIGREVLPILEKTLPGGLDESGRWRWGAASLDVDKKTGRIIVHVTAEEDGKPNLLRKGQLTALWQIARAAAFGGAPASREEIVAVLGGGVPLSKLGAFDVTTTFGSARSLVPKDFPGTRGFDVTAFEVPLDHPLLRAVSLTWENAAAGKLRGVHFRVTPAFEKRLGDLVFCLTKELGAPTHLDTDFAGGKRSSIFVVANGGEPGDVTVHAGDEAHLYINRRGDRYGQAAWRRAFEAIGRCP